MATISLTDRTLRSVQVESRTELWDEALPGFGVRVSPQGDRSFFIMYRYRGVRRRLTLGKYPLLSLAEARQAARVKLGEVAAGLDPAEEREDRRTALSFGDLVEDYLRLYAKQRKRSWREDERILRRDVLPEWHHLAAGEIRKAHVLQLLDAILERGAPIAANRTRAVVSRVFSWALERDLVELNPCAGTRPPAAENRRDRVLNEDEIRALWSALPRELPVIAAAFRLLLLTAQRSVEVKSISARQIQGDLWTIPAAVAKNKSAHLVPLSAEVLAVLADCKPSPTGLLLPSPRRADSALSETALSHAAARISRRLGFDFVPHDLRRTAATYLPSLGTSRFIVARVLNHADPSVTGVYDLYGYLPEKKAALQAWGHHLIGIVESQRGAA